MSEEETAARADLRRAARDLAAFRFRLLGIHATLPVSPQEEAMLEGDEAQDYSTEARSVLECVVTDWIEPAIRALGELDRAEPDEILSPGSPKLPHSEASERAVLGAILLSPLLLETVSTRLRPSHFYIQRHRIIYRALLVLQGKKVEINLCTLQAQIEGQDQLESVGGFAYLASLDLDVPDIGSLDTHMTTIEDRFLLRGLQRPEAEAPDRKLQ
jgi:hypothetical protein